MLAILARAAAQLPRPRERAPAIRRVARAKLARAALQYMDREVLQGPTIHGMAAALGTTTRAVEVAVKHELGIAPSRYLLLKRLHAVRRLLARGATRVTVAAFDCNFEHLGRFAHQYRQLFGELPSQTLRAARERACRLP